MGVRDMSRIMLRDLQAKGVANQEEQEAVTHSRAGQYRRFGAVVMGLSLIPVVGWGLSVLSAAGASD